MLTNENEAAAAARIGARLAVRERSALLWVLRSCFARTQTWLQAGKYLNALVSGLPSRNAWSVAEHAGDRSPGKAQRLLNRASWDERAAMSLVRKYAAAGLDEAARRSRRRRMAVGALDETGQEKQGSSTAGVKRQYMGCAGQVANGINTVHLSYVREQTGYALAGARQWIPAEDIADPVKSLVTGLPLDLRFRTKGQLAIDIPGDAYADGLSFDFVCGDEVYGSCTDLREYLEDRGQAYVLRVASNFTVTLPGGAKMTCADAAKKLLRGKNAWEVRPAGKGSKGRAVARLGLVCGRLTAAQPACPPPPEDRRACLSLLLRPGRAGCVQSPDDQGGRAEMAGEESFELAKSCFGLDQCQARLYTAILRHVVLVMAALAICAVTAARLENRAAPRRHRQPGQTTRRPPTRG